MSFIQVILAGFVLFLLSLTSHVGCDSGLKQENKVDGESSFEIVYPERMEKKRPKRDMDYQPEEYDDHELYKINAFGRDLVLDIQKNKVIIPQNFVVRTFDEQGKEVLEESPVKNCQYQGYVQGEHDSTVLLDTCDGLRGIIDDGKEELSIEPIISEGVNAHKLSRTKKREELKQDFNCGVKGHMPDVEKSSKIENNERTRRSAAIDPLFRSHISVNKTRYAELIIVIDNYVYEKYKRDKQDVKRRAITLANAVDMIYQKINIRIILKAVEIWAGKDLVPYNSKAGPDLANFQKYKERHKDRYASDVIQLMRGKMWDDHGGMAYMTEMCTARSTGVVGWNYWSALGPWLALAHEMGHNFGFDHDADRGKCKCLTPRGCIMATFKTRVPGFSDCNLEDLRKIDDSCLYNVPIKVENPRCGNGVKETNEQCDCGTPENCAVVDPCCNPETCQLYSSSKCSDHHDSCCKNCQVAAAGTICRAATGECDVPETCNGLSGKCPSNDHKMNGEACHFNDMVLVGNDQNSQIKINKLNRSIEARFIRINPRNWQIDICMRAEVYGCDRPAPPHYETSIRSSNNLCVVPKNGRCDKNDMSELRFEQSECKERNTKFRLTKDGVLIHECTGNRVCPKYNIMKWGTKLVVSKHCNKDASKYTRVGQSLRHTKSGLCVHPSGGSAGDGVALVIWKGCKSDRITLSFVEQDCQGALGMENAKIPNDKITASSSRKDKDPMHGRLAGFNSWCANIPNTKQYLQIDLGKIKNISAIATEGTFDGKRVTGYQLFHSNDGQRWTAYTRNKIAKKNSCCMTGKCAPTRLKQCGNQGISKRQSCPKRNGVECAGNGICTELGRCYCNDGFDPVTHCARAIAPRDGGWGVWSSSKSSKCSRMCDGGTKQRHRFCDNPTPSNGGRGCIGKRIEKIPCNTIKCPVVSSCRHLQSIGRKQKINYPSGIYTINPGNQGNVKTYCDMSRDGGGWTLLVTSHTNSWTPSNVKKRSEDNPRLDGDFSILYKADAIKDAFNVQGASFEYRIEAHGFGRWGGIWKAPRSYSFVATNNKQTQIELVKKFDKWKYEDYGIEERMPWIHGAMLTTSHNVQGKKAFGSITANITRFYPAPWINNEEQEQHPTNIWYWMREGEVKEVSSCMDLQLRGLQNKPFTNGVFDIKTGGRTVKTYCDFTTDGGGWTLLLTSSSRTGWMKRTVVDRNTANPSLDTDYSILGFSRDIIKNKHFQYKIEDGTSSWGGIFEAEAGQSLTTRRPQKQPRLLKQLGNWDKKTMNLAKTVPYIKDRTLLLTTSTKQGDSSGTLVSSSPNSGSTYLPLKNKRPSVVRLWVREGTWRSCNEIKIKAGQHRSKLQDAVYMIKNRDHQYLPVMCDMTSDPGAWTLLVTSANKGWQNNQVKYRNTGRPSLSRDYSILGLGDQIKSLSGGTTFKYKLEANTRGHWGGVWEVPIEYSFVATDNKQTNVKLVKQFDKWAYNDWRSAIEKRMPWLGKTKGLLTTSSHSSYYEYGSVISDTSSVNNPALWISPAMINPGLIWYWVNEDDCGHNRLPVHGDVSSWSAWSQCSPMCSSSGERTRRRTCSSPAPRCGGTQCNPDMLATQKQLCHYCPRSPIKNINNLCLQPKTADCNPPDGTELVYKTGPSNCDRKHMYFILGSDGILVHQCSGKRVCPEGSKGSFIKVNSQCDQNKAKFERTVEKGLKHLDSGLCVHPYLGTPGDGVKLVTWSGCTSPAGTQKLKLDLFQLGLQGSTTHVLKLVKPPKSKPVKPTKIIRRGSTTRVLKLVKPKGKPVKPTKINRRGSTTRVLKLVKPKGKPVKPTKINRRVSPIRSHGGFCLQPITSNCSPSNGTQIIYHGTGGNNVQCNKDYMKFTLTKQGVLKHTCSNMYVCPEPDFYDVGGSLWNSIPMVLKRHGCDPHKVYYTRTSAKSLRFKTSNYCVHPESGTPSSNSNAVFWDECDLDRIALDFYDLSD